MVLSLVIGLFMWSSCWNYRWSLMAHDYLIHDTNLKVFDMKTEKQLSDIMERKQVLSQVNINTDMFLTSFEKVAQLLLEQKDKLEREGWINLHLEMEYSNEFAELIVMGMRLENDDEYNERIADEQKKLLAIQKKEERERKKYEKLKLKFES